VTPSQPLILLATSDTLPAELPPVLSSFFAGLGSFATGNEGSSPADPTRGSEGIGSGGGGQCIVEVAADGGAGFRQAVERAAEVAANTIASEGEGKATSPFLRRTLP